jgi:hypothetical protein
MIRCAVRKVLVSWCDGRDASTVDFDGCAMSAELLLLGYFGVPPFILNVCANGEDSDSARGIAKITSSLFLVGMVDRLRP